jgi:hypothetical protein
MKITSAASLASPGKDEAKRQHLSGYEGNRNKDGSGASRPARNEFRQPVR